MKRIFIIFSISSFLNLNVFAYYDTTKVLFSCIRKNAPSDEARREVRVVDDYNIFVVSTNAANNGFHAFGPYWRMNKNDIKENNDKIFKAEHKQGSAIGINYQRYNLEINVKTGEGKLEYLYRSLSGCGGFERKEGLLELVDCQVVEQM